MKVKLTETKLKQIVAGSVRMVLNESFDDNFKSAVDNALQRIKNGEDLNRVFDYCGDFQEGYATVELKEKWNWIDKKGNLLFPNCAFESCSNFHDGVALVSTPNMEHRYFIDKKGYLYDCDSWEYGTENPLGNVKGSLWNVKGVQAYKWKNFYSVYHQDDAQTKKPKNCYSVFYQDGNKANNHSLSKRDALELAMDLEDIGHEVIVARNRDYGWETIYETK